MAKFDQRGQKVNNQVNAENINFSNLIFSKVQNRADFVAELKKLLVLQRKVAQDKFG